MSDSEDDLLSFCGVSNVEDMKEQKEFINAIELAILNTDVSLLPSIKEDKDNQSNQLLYLSLATMLISGEYLSCFLSPVIKSCIFDKLSKTCQEPESEDTLSSSSLSSLRDIDCNTILLPSSSDDENSYDIPLLTLIAGIASLSLFTQANYTGPSLEIPTTDKEDRIALLLKSNYYSDNEIHVLLASDGDFPHTQCFHPIFLLYARLFLRSSVKSSDDSSFITASWWNARTCVVNQRLLISSEPSPSSLCDEALESYNSALEVFKSTKDSLLLARLHIEIGLAHSVFQLPKMGRECFQEAQQTSGLETNLTGALGKRTKYQVKNVAQMVLNAKSASSVYSNTSSTITNDDDDSIKKKKNGNSSQFVSLDEANPDNILLEEIKFKEEEGGISNNNLLSVTDQAILLASCLDVANHNPKDCILTTEQMMPYLERVLSQVQDNNSASNSHNNNSNWMVYSTALLEKAELEFHKSSHTRERAVLQLQVLVDQHFESVTTTQEDESSPAKRLEYIYVLSFPPIYVLRSTLALKYASLGVYKSAVDLFTALEMWDHVIECYQAMDLNSTAERVIKERLALSGESPFLLTAMGDVTSDISYYKKALSISNNTYARAARTLGRYYFNKNEYEEAIAYFNTALKVRPNSSANVGTWFTLGTAYMRISSDSSSKNALQAFTRVIQVCDQDYDPGMAWGNIGSIYLTYREFSKAHKAFSEALKTKRNIWQLWENFALCSMEMKKYGDVMACFHALLDIRKKKSSNNVPRDIDHELLAWLVEELVVTSENNDHQQKRLIELFGRITSVVSTNPFVWQVYAYLNENLKPARLEKAIECREKEVRALNVLSRDSTTTTNVAKATGRLAASYLAEGSDKSKYTCKLMLKNYLKKVDTLINNGQDVVIDTEILEELQSMLKSLL